MTLQHAFARERTDLSKLLLIRSSGAAYASVPTARNTVSIPLTVRLAATSH